MKPLTENQHYILKVKSDTDEYDMTINKVNSNIYTYDMSYDITFILQGKQFISNMNISHDEIEECVNIGKWIITNYPENILPDELFTL